MVFKIRIPCPVVREESDGVENEDDPDWNAPPKKRSSSGRRASKPAAKRPRKQAKRAEAAPTTLTTEIETQTDSPPLTKDASTMKTEITTNFPVLIGLPNGCSGERKMSEDTARYLGRLLNVIVRQCGEPAIGLTIRNTLAGGDAHPYDPFAATMLVNQIMLSDNLTARSRFFETALQVGPRYKERFDHVTLLVKSALCNKKVDMKWYPMTLHIGGPVIKGQPVVGTGHTEFLLSVARWRPDLFRFLLMSKESSWKGYEFTARGILNQVQVQRERDRHWSAILGLIAGMKRLSAQQEHPAFQSVDGRHIADVLFLTVVRCMGSDLPSSVNSSPLEYFVCNYFFDTLDVVFKDLALDSGRLRMWINLKAQQGMSNDERNKIQMLVLARSPKTMSWGQIDLKRGDAGYTVFETVMRSTKQFDRLDAFAEYLSSDAGSSSTPSSSDATYTAEWYKDPNAPQYDTGGVEEQQGLRKDAWYKDKEKLAKEAIDLTDD